MSCCLAPLVRRVSYTDQAEAQYFSCFHVSHFCNPCCYSLKAAQRVMFGSWTKRSIRGGVLRMLELSAIVDRVLPRAQVRAGSWGGALPWPFIRKWPSHCPGPSSLSTCAAEGPLCSKGYSKSCTGPGCRQECLAFKVWELSGNR